MARNVSFNLVSQSWSALLLVVTVPIILHAIGEAAFGVYVLGTIALGYTAVLDLGLTPALVRSIAIRYSRGELRHVQGLLGTGFALFIVIGVVGCCLIALLAPFASAHLFHIARADQADATFVLDIAAFGFLCNMCLTPFAAVPLALQRIDLFAARSLLLSTTTAGAQIAAIASGLGLRGVAVATVAVSVSSVLVFVVVSRRLLPGVSFRPRIEWWALRDLSAFGAMKFIS